MEQNGWKYEAILARSFSRQDRKTMGWCATLAIFILIFTFCIFYITPNNHLCSKRNEAKPIICDLKQERSDTCEASGDIRVVGNSSTIFVVSNVHSTTSWTIRPYARKGDEYALRSVRNLTIAEVHHSDQQIPGCTRKHNVPAVVFSTGGYSGNLFHDFSDLLIPLYLTSREFDGEVQFLVTDKSPRWMNKFKEVLQRLSRHEIIDLDREKDSDNVFCFQRIILGLRANKEFSINNVSSDHHISMKNFTAFLRNAYDLKRDNIANKKLQQPPRLLVIARNKTRRLLNTGEVSAMAEDLGFKVVVQETDSNMTKVSKLVNGLEVMVGVHGAGLSNMVFLPENAVVVQIVGLGMNWVAWNDYELPSSDMGLRYLDYKVGENESSLKNSSSIGFKGWIAYTFAYLNGQDFKVDVNRFRGTLLKALELLHRA